MADDTDNEQPQDTEADAPASEDTQASGGGPA